MDICILKARTTCLKKNLESVKDILIQLENRNKIRKSCMQEVENELGYGEGTIGGSIKNILGLIDELGDTTRQSTEFHISGKCSAADKVDNILNDLRKEVAILNDILKSCRRKIDFKDKKYIYTNINKDVAKTLRTNLIGKARDCISDIERIEKLLDEEIKPQNDNNGQTGDQINHNPWIQFYERLDGDCFNVFVEYFTFLSGLALRDLDLIGLSKSCLCADLLIRQCQEQYEIDGSYLAMPALKDAMTKPLSFARFGFPECTIWALPLTLREIGLILSEEEVGIIELIDKCARDIHERSAYREYVADAFGTFTLGPAYSWACVLMMLNPLSAYTEGHAKRARVIFSMMEKMQGENADGDYKKIASVLDKLWLKTLKQAGISGDIPESEMDKLNNFVASLHNMLKNKAKGYELYQWRKIDQKILGQKVIIDKIRAEGCKLEELGLNDIRDALNFAWGCRILYPEDKDLLKRIEESFADCPFAQSISNDA